MLELDSCAFDVNIPFMTTASIPTHSLFKCFYFSCSSPYCVLAGYLASPGTRLFSQLAINSIPLFVKTGDQ